MSQTTEKRSRFSRFGRWIAELILVFVGVYAAFWLNSYQQHLQDAERRDQILASLEQQLREASRAEKLTARTRNGQPRSFSTRSRLERCRRCVRLFLRPTTAQLTGLRCCNPEASSCLTCRRSWRCATTNPLSAGDWAAWLGTKN